MARDFGDLFFDFSTMTDDEIYDVVVQQLREYPNIDPDWMEVEVRDGHVTLSGRVGTDGEKQVAEKIIVEALGISNFTNHLVVDELVRGDVPEAIDEALVYEQELDDHLGGGIMNQEDTASHLMENLEVQTYGTRDVQQAIEEGAPYEPPDRPLPDGYGSEEAH
ncbi:MAG TPA: BON domain-containing protein [Longimicrobiaceae bacterium]|nr:BON domain-containing protein [Longimicrobiaceae bacterium]